MTELRSDALADRYGTARPGRRRAVIVVSGVVGVVALAWVAWAAWAQDLPDELRAHATEFSRAQGIVAQDDAELVLVDAR